MKRYITLIVIVLLVKSISAQQKQLAFFIDNALQNSPLLKEYQNQVQRSKLDSARIAAGLGFQVTAISNNSYAPVIKGWGYDEAITNGANISAVVSVSKEFTGLQNRQNRYEAIGLQTQSARNSSKISEQELKKSVTNQYITTYSDGQQVKFNSEMLKLLAKEEAVLKQLTESGVYKQVDYLAFCVSQRQQKLLVTNLKNQYNYNYLTLCYLCGIEDTTTFILTDPEIKADVAPDLSSSVFYQQFVLDSLKLQNYNKLIDYSYKPKISAYVDGGYNSSLTYLPARNFGTSAGIMISVPLYDGGQRKIQHSQLSIDEQNRANYLHFFKVQYRQQQNRLLQQLKANQEVAEQITEQIVYTKALVDADRKLLETGDIRIADYTLAIANYLNANNLLAQNTVERYQIINELNYWNRTK